MIEFEYCSSIAGNLEGGGSGAIGWKYLGVGGDTCWVRGGLFMGANKNNVITMCFPRVSVYGGYPGHCARSIMLPGYVWLPGGR